MVELTSRGHSRIKKIAKLKIIPPTFHFKSSSINNRKCFVFQFTSVNTLLSGKPAYHINHVKNTFLLKKIIFLHSNNL